MPVKQVKAQSKELHTQLSGEWLTPSKARYKYERNPQRKLLADASQEVSVFDSPVWLHSRDSSGGLKI